MATRAPPVQLPWIGYRFEMGSYTRKLEAAGFVVEKTRDASSALTLVQQRKYPLLIVQDWFPAGNLDLPDGFDERNPASLTVHFLRQLRTLSHYRDKPVIVTHFLDNSDAEKLRVDDRVFLFDSLNDSSGFDGLVQAVRSHL